jgi:hypothetical protein
MILGTLSSASLKVNRKYLRGRQRCPLKVSERPLNKAAAVFEELQLSVERKECAVRRQVSWISSETWKMIDSRVAMRRLEGHDRAAIRRLTRRIQASLKVDRKRRVTIAGEKVEALLAQETPDLQGAWNALKGWYREAGDRAPPPSRDTLEKVTKERIDLYTKEAPPGDPIPIIVDPVEVSDEIPGEEEIADAVKRLRNNRSGGPSGIRGEHLKGWLAAAEAGRDDTLWQKLVYLIQHAFETGEIPDAMAWSVMVLLPKGGGDFRGIGLVEVIWKVVAIIINERFKSTISFHDTLHGFRAGRGCGTATIEAKLCQQLAAVDQVPLYQIYLDLRKAYDALDRERCLEILEGYGTGRRIVRLLSNYWKKQRIVAKASGYHGDPFGATRGVTQGDPVSPTIFNIVVDAVVRCWLSQVCGADAALSGLGYEVKNKCVLFYADDGLLAGRKKEWVQDGFDVLIGLFERVGLRTNTGKTKAMICMPGHISGRQSDEAYERRMTGNGDDFRERQRRKVVCSICGNALAQSSLAHHMRVQHGQTSGSGFDPQEVIGDPAEYRVSFPKTATSIDCPVEGCPGKATSRTKLRSHFMYRHARDIIVILDEGSHPHPRCHSCDMFVPRPGVYTTHPRTAMCRNGADRKRQRLALERARSASECEFTAYGVPLEAVQEFKYLGRLLSRNDDDWPAVHRNLSKARKSWARISRILAREGATPRVSGMFYKAVVQSVLLFGSETWVLSQPMLRALEGFHRRVARRLAGKQPYLDRRTGEWVYPPIDKVLEEVGMYSIDHYVKKRQNTVADYVATRPILTYAKNQSGRRVPVPAGDGGIKLTKFSMQKTLVMKGNKSV